MEKLILEKFIIAGKSSYEMAKLTNKSQSVVRYWLKKYDLRLKQQHTYDDTVTIKKCSQCNQDKNISEFYKKSNRKTNHTTCKECFNINVVNRLRQIKQDAVAMKGGKCCICGYDKYIGSLHFHHLDPTQKDMQISHINRSLKNQDFLNELTKCILVCANCHNEIHGGLVDVSNINTT